MDLVDQIAGTTGTDRDKTQSGLGILLFSLRLAIDSKSFEAIKQAIPEVQTWAQKPPAAARTGEMLALSTPGTVMRQLHTAGYTDDQAKTLGNAVRAALADRLPADLSASLAGAIERAIP